MPIARLGQERFRFPPNNVYKHYMASLKGDHTFRGSYSNMIPNNRRSIYLVPSFLSR